eukprot:TRINITY_DN22236_c0_g1_i1.p1 TRINITY_DN22236_c0_g1~~TRINITY_DN22236_c0_g1_i1.p1  ORF type:complete len:302 (-),score=36.43 TRINITY_DN22236_c0_g1_i1:147-1052(-)
MSEPENCGVYSGLTGKLVVAGLSSLAFAIYLTLYVIRRHVLHTEPRTAKVFFWDLSKLAIGQSAAWSINVLNTSRNQRWSSDFDPLSWYFPTFVADELFAVPLGVIFGRAVCALARHLRAQGLRSWDCLARYGRYYPDDAEHSPLLYLGQPRERGSWWLAQLLSWVACVAVSRLLGGMVLPVLGMWLGDDSPFHVAAYYIYVLGWSCDTKRLVFAGILRLTIDFLQIAVVDFFNKYIRNRSASAGKHAQQHDDEAPPPLAPHTGSANFRLPPLAHTYPPPGQVMPDARGRSPQRTGTWKPR